jgi:hypothetical protein
MGQVVARNACLADENHSGYVACVGAEKSTATTSKPVWLLG